MAGASCTSDQNCTGFRLCYTNVSWSPLLDRFCDCETPYYGWVGPDCNQLGPTTYVGLFMYLTLMLASLPPMIFGVMFAVDVWRNPELGRWSSLVQTFVLVTACFSTYFFYGLFNVLERVTPEAYTQFFLGERSHSLAPFSGAATILVIAFFAFAGSNTILTWIDLVNSVGGLYKAYRLPRIRLLLRGLQVYKACIFIAVAVTRNATILGVGLAPISLGMLALFVFGRNKLARIFNSVIKPQERQNQAATGFIEQLLPLVERTFIIIALTLFLLLTFFVTAAVIDSDRRNICPKGIVSPVLMFLLLVATAGWIGNLGIALYVYVLLYDRRLKLVGPLPYRKHIESFLFAGYSKFDNSRSGSQVSTKKSNAQPTRETATLAACTEGRLRFLKTRTREGFAKLRTAATSKSKAIVSRFKSPSSTLPVSRTSSSALTTNKAPGRQNKSESEHGIERIATDEAAEDREQWFFGHKMRYCWEGPRALRFFHLSGRASSTASL